MDNRAAEEPKASEGDSTTIKPLVECEKVDDAVASITEPVTETGVKDVGFIIPQELCAESALKFIKEIPPSEIKAEEKAFVGNSQPEEVNMECDASVYIKTAGTTDVLGREAIRKELESIGDEATEKTNQVAETTEESLNEHIQSEKQGEGVENIAVSLDEQLEQDIAESKEAKLFQKRDGDSNGLNKNLKEKTAQEFVGGDDGTESQESMGLVIDEKMDIQEDQQSDSALTDIAFENINETARKDRNSKDNERNSCEDTSEASVATQIDANELSNKLRQHLKEEAKGVSADTAKSATVNVIEIDDDADEKAEQATEREGEEVVIVAEKEIPVIEIDDDEEEVKAESILPAQGITENQSTSNQSLKRVEDVKMNVNLATNDQEKIEKDVEMKDLTTMQEELPTVQASVEEAATTIFGADESNSLLKAALSRRPESPAAATDDNLPDDTRDEVFYKKECINYECSRTHKQYFRVPHFALSYFKVAKKRFKLQYICADCYDKALDMYEEFCGLLTAKQPLLLKDIAGGRQEFVEIIDSSDEEEAGAPVEKEKDGPSFSQTDLDLIEQELEKSIKQVLANVEIQNQLTWSKELLATRAKRLEEESNYIDAELRSLQKKADNMHVSLYQCPKIKIRQLQPFDLNSGRPYLPLDSEISQLPPIGEIQRFPVQINEMYYAVKNKAIASWVPCKVIEQVEGTSGAQKNLTHYKVKFLKSQYQMLKTVSVKHLAYYDPPPIRLPIGSRVIAYFDASSLSRGKEKMLIQSAFYPGIIAEPLKPNNKYRYLIFYDDGYTQYVSHKDVRLVCSVAENVWEDVHPGSRDFIQKYLTQYSINRPMVQTQKGQSMTTESNGKWIYARVVDIDCSLIQMQFEGPKSHTEWIYRGSLRLGPVFKEYQKTLQKDNMPISRLPRRTEPFIRYTADEEASVTPQQPERSASTEARAVAKKSVSRQESTLSNAAQLPVPTVRHLNNSTIYLEDENKPKGKVVYYTAKRNLPPLTYKPHRCSPSCLFKITHNLNAYSPLSKPLLSGWERLVMRQKIKKVVAYRGPCGKIMRNMKELHHYLRVTQNMLNVDNFDFNHDTNCLAEYVIESAIVQKRDISGGQEKMAIPLVNYYDSTMPPECKYAAQRIPTEGVNLNLDEEFLVGCDCDDDCSDKEKCSCWQLTYAGAKYGNPNTPMDEIGYQYKRLYEHVPTGIYECNSRCKCKSSCLNRVVQHSLQMKLQVFKTSNRGWGLRCINDVPKGSFICIYAGHLLTEAKANEGGLDAGDEYFAELDYIEVAEQIKEGYESDVDPPEPEEDEDVYAPDQDDDDEFTPSKSFLTRSKNKAQKLTRNNAGQIVDEDSQERQVINFNPNADMNENSVRESSIRKLFGKDEACYVMDAKTIGNLGRYFNHSCSPNLFVQNVFVDTHDLRFPWVAFFALTHIRAGTELTWNYNYEVGVVPGKVLYCQCGAPNCRLRLL